MSEAASQARALLVEDEEDGMRLDRWFKRRLPDLAIGHLNKIVRTGQVRVDGARAQISTRLATGQSVRVPPLRLEPRSEAPVRPAASPQDAPRAARHDPL